MAAKDILFRSHFWLW